MKLILLLALVALSGCVTVNKSINIANSCHVDVTALNVSATDTDAKDLLDVALPLF